MKFDSISYIAPSTCIPLCRKSVLNRAAGLMKRRLEASRVYFSPHLFSSDHQIDHVTASAEERAGVFKDVIRRSDLIVSVAGGTGAEDIVGRIDRKDYRVIRERRPVFIGFSDFTFLMHEIYYAARVPGVYFPSLRVGNGNMSKLIPLLNGEEIQYTGAVWLTPPPPRRISGIPIGGNLSTFVNFLNRTEPPRFSWSRHILFVEDIHVDVEDLHRLLAALGRHDVFKRIRGLVVGSFTNGNNSSPAKRQKEFRKFIRTYLDDTLQWRRKQGIPLPILAVNNFGHDCHRDLMAVPVGGHVTISRNRKVVFRLAK